MKHNYQRGTIYEASGSFYVRYRTPDGRKSHWLCDKKDDAVHNSTTAPVVKELADPHMVEMRKKRQTSGSDGVVANWGDVYLKTVTAHLKPSTVEGYRQIWDNTSKSISQIAHLLTTKRWTATGCSPT